MNILITLTTIGADQGTLFDLYSNVDGFNNPFDTDITNVDLLAGYTTTTAPDGTSVVRVCGQNAACTNCVDISPTYTTSTTTTEVPVVECEGLVGSGGLGVTEYIIPLEPAGGVLTIDFFADSVPDKLEILHNGIKVATSGMTVDNSGPFDPLYGDPAVPADTAATLTVDQFIGQLKGIPPTRDAAFYTDTGLNIQSNAQQLVWFKYTPADYAVDSNAVLRITGPGGTAWTITRRCIEDVGPPITTTSTTTLAEFTTTSSTTTIPSGVTTGVVSTASDPTDACGLTLFNTIYINPSVPNTITVGDLVYLDAFGATNYTGDGNYQAITITGGPGKYSARISPGGEILEVVFCGV